MRSILQKVLAPALMAAAALATQSAMAETTLKVPFSFTVSGKNCPAGRYFVEENTNHSIVTLKSADSKQIFTWVLSSRTYDPAANNIILNFKTSGQTHVLRSIQVGPMSTPTLDNKSLGNQARSEQLAVPR